MATLTALGRSLVHNRAKKTNLCSNSSPQLFNLTKPNNQNLILSRNSSSFCSHYNNNNNSTSHYMYQSCRTLILESVSSEFIQLFKLPDLDSGIIEVKLGWGHVKNAIGRDMLRGLRHTFDAIRKDSSINVVAISNAIPKVFCVGADLKERKTMSASEVHNFVNFLRSTFSFIETVHIPTIAVIKGATLGDGLEMALSCDLRICGGTQWRPRLVGKSVAKELIFIGQKIRSREAMWHFETLGSICREAATRV